MKMRALILLLTFIFLPLPLARASNLCSACCTFGDFFKADYQKLMEHIKPDDETRRFFNILLNAYLIKFEGLDFEYKAKCDALKNDENSGDTKRSCLGEQKKHIKGLTEIAIEEYDNFLDDLSFEICGCENAEQKNIKKNKKRYKKALKKCIAKNCK